MKKAVFILLVIISILFLSYNYLYHEHRNISNEKAVFSIAGTKILQDFSVDESKANFKYLDKTVAVKGKITSIDALNKTIIIDEKVFILLKKISDVKQNEVITIQGRVIGYDSLLEEIKIDQAEIK